MTVEPAPQPFRADEAVAATDALHPLGVPILRRLRADPAACVGLAVVGALVILAALGPALAPFNPLAISNDRLQGPGLRHLLGTDGLGRDLLSRLLHGARLSLGSTILASGLVTIIGTVVGTISGFAGGLVDKLCMRLVDVVLTVPALILALASPLCSTRAFWP